MTNKKDENSELLTKLISTVQKKNDKEKVNDSVKSKQARVIGVDDETHKVFVYFLDDIEEKEYKFLNKTGEVIGVGDTVKVFYTSNSAKGWIGERCGEPRYDGGYSLEPITSININSNIDYSVYTNAGIERYVGIFEGE